MTSLSRRELLKSSIAASTAAVAGLPVSTAALAQAAGAEAGWRWDKGVCRMCGTGCGIQVATVGGRAGPAPANHYVTRDGAPLALAGRQYNCMACHAPQAAVPPLVRNTSL